MANLHPSAHMRMNDEPWYYSQHAIEQLQRRGDITTKMVKEVILNFDRIEPSNNKRGLNGMRYCKNFGNKDLRVPVHIVDGVTIITTVMWGNRNG